MQCGDVIGPPLVQQINGLSTKASSVEAIEEDRATASLRVPEFPGENCRLG